MSNDTQPTTEQRNAALANEIDQQLAAFVQTQVVTALKNELVLARGQIAALSAEIATMNAAQAKRERKGKKDTAE
jgi:hypothetical protein